MGGMYAALMAECHAAASLVAAWARAVRVGTALMGTVAGNWNGARNNWHGNNWHGNNWHGKIGMAGIIMATM